MAIFQSFTGIVFMIDDFWMGLGGSAGCNKLMSVENNDRSYISPSTLIVLENGQVFTGNPANRDLIIVYGPTTRSIPAQTTPYKIIVMC